MAMCLLLSSFAVAHQADEDVFERALIRVQILELNPEFAQPFDQGRNVPAFLIAVKGVFQLVPGRLARQSPVAQLQRNRRQRLEQAKGQLFLAELFHQLDFILDHDQLALVNHPDSIRHLLRLVDVVGGQDDRHTAFAISTRRFMPPESVMILSSRFSHSDRSRSTFSMCAGFGARPNSPRLKLAVAHTVSNISVVSSCGTRPIFDRAGRYSRAMSWLSTRTTPDVGVTMPQMMFIKVLFPAPLGPNRAKISPLRILRSIRFNAWR